MAAIHEQPAAAGLGDLAALPLELLDLSLAHLDEASRANCRLVSKAMRRVASNGVTTLRTVDVASDPDWPKRLARCAEAFPHLSFLSFINTAAADELSPAAADAGPLAVCLGSLPSLCGALRELALVGFGLGPAAVLALRPLRQLSKLQLGMCSLQGAGAAGEALAQLRLQHLNLVACPECVGPAVHAAEAGTPVRLEVNGALKLLMAWPDAALASITEVLNGFDFVGPSELRLLPRMAGLRHLQLWKLHADERALPQGALLPATLRSLVLESQDFSAQQGRSYGRGRPTSAADAALLARWLRPGGLERLVLSVRLDHAKAREREGQEERGAREGERRELAEAVAGLAAALAPRAAVSLRLRLAWHHHGTMADDAAAILGCLRPLGPRLNKLSLENLVLPAGAGRQLGPLPGLRDLTWRCPERPLRVTGPSVGAVHLAPLVREQAPGLASLTIEDDDPSVASEIELGLTHLATSSPGAAPALASSAPPGQQQGRAPLPALAVRWFTSLGAEDRNEAKARIGRLGAAVQAGTAGGSGCRLSVREREFERWCRYSD